MFSISVLKYIFDELFMVCKEGHTLSDTYNNFHLDIYGLDIFRSEILVLYL